MKHASESPFAARMMEKPLPDSLNTDSNFRFFLDPPEMIQIAMGGRPWFFSTATRAVHRLGLLKGLGWELDPIRIAQSEDHCRGITGVQIFYCADTRQCLMLFVRRGLSNNDNSSPPSIEVIETRSGVSLADLRTVYAAVLGEEFL